MVGGVSCVVVSVRASGRVLLRLKSMAVDQQCPHFVAGAVVGKPNEPRPESGARKRQQSESQRNDRHEPNRAAPNCRNRAKEQLPLRLFRRQSNLLGITSLALATSHAGLEMLVREFTEVGASSVPEHMGQPIGRQQTLSPARRQCPNRMQTRYQSMTLYIYNIV